MFKKSATNAAIESLVGKNTQIEGNLTFAGGIRIDGRVKGNVIAVPMEKSVLILSETALIEGEIRAGHVILNGEIRGPVYSSHLLELQPKAKILGSVHYQSLEMHYGALIDGDLHHNKGTTMPEKSVEPDKTSAPVITKIESKLGNVTPTPKE